MADLRPLKDIMGRFLTQSLFYEYKNDNYLPSFTLKSYDHIVDGIEYKSLKLLYLELAHAPYSGEYEFAMSVFGSWEHWERLCSTNVILPYINEWRRELEIKLTSSAINSMIKTALLDGSRGTPAAKWLAEKGYLGPKRGRPSKHEIAAERKAQAEIANKFSDDLKRISSQEILPNG